MIDWNGALVTTRNKRPVRVVGTVRSPRGLRYVLAASRSDGDENLLVCDENGFGDESSVRVVRNAGRIVLIGQQIRRGLGELEELVETIVPGAAMTLEDGSMVDYTDVLRQAIEALEK